MVGKYWEVIWKTGSLWKPRFCDIWKSKIFLVLLLQCKSGEALDPHAHNRLNTFFNILQIFIITTANGPDIVILTLGIFSRLNPQTGNILNDGWQGQVKLLDERHFAKEGEFNPDQRNNELCVLSFPNV